MKTSEFIQTIRTTIYLSNKINNLIDIVNQIDTIRKVHSKFQSQLEYLLLDSVSYEQQSTRDEIQRRAIEIKQYANEFKINVSFNKLPNDYSDFSDQFKQTKSFAKYFYNNIDITNLIVYSESKQKKQIEQKQNENVVALRELDFNTDENEPGIKVLDEHGNNLNVLDGL